MADIEDLTKLKKMVERRRAEAERAAGALERAMAQLKDEFGCSSIEEARRMLRKLEQQTKTAKMQFDKTFEAFMEEWGDALVGNS